MQDSNIVCPNKKKTISLIDSENFSDLSPKKLPESSEPDCEEVKTIEVALRSRPRSIAFSGVHSDFIQGVLNDLPINSEDIFSKPTKSENEDETSLQAEFIVKNIDTGETHRITEYPCSMNMISLNLDQKKEKPWKSFWKEVKSKIEQIWDCAESGDLKSIKSIILGENVYPLDLNARSLDQWTALHMACNEGHIDIVEFLLKQEEVNVNALTSIKRIPLHLAAMRGHYEIVKMLIEKKAEIDAIDEELYTPLHYAAERGCENSVKELLKNGARIDIKTHEGMLAIDMSQDHKVREVFREVKANMEENFGRTSYGNFVRTNSRADYVKRLLVSNKAAAVFK